MNIQDNLKKIGIVTSNKNIGSRYSWQDLAVRYWNDLKISGKPNKNWFKLFKTGKVGVLQSAYSVTMDAGVTNPEFYFYKVYWNKIKQ